MVPELGSYQLALQRYEEKLSRTLIIFLLKISLLTELSHRIITKKKQFSARTHFFSKKFTKKYTVIKIKYFIGNLHFFVYMQSLTAKKMCFNKKML